ncbi:Basic leucine zipper domain containing protein [Dorcoceras hygrometricum]|uniref:Basic leucine zipper domain containing protein n=1 Tax=Dorcoceras hygrometricum TaxID=472368 RepID=A0A2Z7D616_9LAMI|nr:Basic leucine zipper domain containing protein [Dorcoceras hygrometricum]
MASSLIANAIQINFDSVLGISDNDGMVNMFKALEASGLRGFLGCPSTLYERELEQFFDTAIVQEVLKEMVDKTIKRAKGFVVQICVLLKSDPAVTLGDAKNFPQLKIISAKNVSTYVATNKTIYSRGDTIEPVVSKVTIVRNKLVSKKKSSPNDADDEPVEVVAEKAGSRKRPAINAPTVKKKKRTSKGNAAHSQENLEVVSVAQEAVPIQMIAPTSAVPAEQPPVPKRRAPKRKFRMPEVSDDEIVDKKADVKNVVEKQSDEPFADVVVKEPAMEIIAEKEAETSVDDVDSIIQQILVDTAQLETDVGEPGITDAEEQVGLRTDTIPEIGETVVDGTVVGEQMVQRSDETENRTDISFAEFTALDFQVFTSETDRMFETGSESEDELEMSASKQPSQMSESENRVVESASAAYLVEEPIEETEQNQGTEIADAVPTADAKISDDESMTLEEHLSTIPNGSSLPSTTGEVTKIQFGKRITIRGVDEGDWYKASLPKIPAADKGKAPLQERNPIKENPVKEIFSLILQILKIDSTRIALQRRMYILTKYRELLLRKFLEAKNTKFVPGQSLPPSILRYWLCYPIFIFLLWNSISDDESMTLEEHLSTIPNGSSLPSTTGEVTKTQFGKRITIRGVDEGDWYKASLPKIPVADIELLVQLREKVIDEVDAFLNSFRLKRLAVLKLEEIYVKEEQVLSWAETDSTRIALQRRMYILTKYRELLLRKFLEAKKTNFVPGQSSSAIDLKLSHSHSPSYGILSLRYLSSRCGRKEVLTISRANYCLKSTILRNPLLKLEINKLNTFRNLLRVFAKKPELKAMFYRLKLNEFQKGTRAHRAFITTELADIRKEVKAMNEQLSTIWSEMLDFRAQAQENHLNLSTQLGFLVDYINRGGDAKKGEGGSSRPQPPPDDQSRPSGGSGSRGSGGDGSSQRRDRGGSSKKRHSNSSGGVHHISGGGGPIKRDAEYWIYGKRQF